jgi:hypothetical protein
MNLSSTGEKSVNFHLCPAMPVSVSALRVASSTSVYRRQHEGDRESYRPRSSETQYIRHSPTAICPAWHQVGCNLKKKIEISSKFSKNQKRLEIVQRAHKTEIFLKIPLSIFFSKISKILGFVCFSDNFQRFLIFLKF